MINRKPVLGVFLLSMQCILRYRLCDTEVNSENDKIALTNLYSTYSETFSKNSYSPRVWFSHFILVLVSPKGIQAKIIPKCAEVVGKLLALCCSLHCCLFGIPVKWQNSEDCNWLIFQSWEVSSVKPDAPTAYTQSWNMFVKVYVSVCVIYTERGTKHT